MDRASVGAKIAHIWTVDVLSEGCPREDNAILAVARNRNYRSYPADTPQGDSLELFLLFPAAPDAILDLLSHGGSIWPGPRLAQGLF